LESKNNFLSNIKQLTRIKHVFFDLDHTLWDFEKNSDLTFQKLFKDYEIDLDIAIFLEVYKSINFKYWRLYRQEKVSKEQLRYQRLKEAFDAVHFSISDQLIDTLAIQYIEVMPHFNHLFEGAIDILNYLKDKYQLHIITNGFEEVQAKKMKSSKILHYFDQVITSESVGVKKPNPIIFEHALSVAKATTENSIMIGDSLEADIEGAINFGIKAIYCDFENNNTKSNTFETVKSLFEIKQLL
jgi:putative hydrolase of the HAD superfamily